MYAVFVESEGRFAFSENDNGGFRISSEDHDSLMAAQSTGKVIVPDAAGRPVCVDPSSLISLSLAQDLQCQRVSAACAASLMAGFESSALGQVHTYGSSDSDQRNVLSAALASQEQAGSWTALLWCASNGAWTFAAHTASQVMQVNDDWLAFRQALQKKCADLIAQIKAAKTVGAVQALNW